MQNLVCAQKKMENAALHFNDSLMLVGPAPGKALPCQGEVLVAGRQENARMVTSSMLRM